MTVRGFAEAVCCGLHVPSRVSHNKSPNMKRKGSEFMVVGGDERLCYVMAVPWYISQAARA